MGFDGNAFLKQEFEHSTESIPVPALAEWFDGDPNWEVRRLVGNELAHCLFIGDKYKKKIAALEALESGRPDEMISGMKEIFGNAEDVHSELKKRLEVLVFGSVCPEINMSIAIKIADTFPIEFMMITSKIISLTGIGAVSLKPKPSGMTQVSEDA